MVSYQFTYIFRIFDRQVITQTGSNGDALNTRKFTRRPIKLSGGFVTGVQVFTDGRVHTGQSAAILQNCFALTGQVVHVGRRATEIGNGAGKARYFVADLFNFVQYGFLRTALNNAPFVLGN